MGRKPTQNARPAVVEAIARGCSKAEAARLAGVSRSTVDRILEEPGISDEIDEFRRTMLVNAANRLAGATAAAVDELKKLLKEKSPSVRLSVVKGILDTACRYHELIVFDHRLEEIEKKLGGLRSTMSEHHGRNS